MPNVPNYGVRVFWSDEDNEYVAVCDELPEVSGLGSTFEEAVRELQVALEGVVKIYAEDAEELPAVRPVETAYSGKLNVRLGKSLHRDAARFAEIEGVSLNQFIQNSVSRECGRREGRLQSENSLRSFQDEVTAKTQLWIQIAVTKVLSQNIVLGGAPQWSRGRAATSASIGSGVFVPAGLTGDGVMNTTKGVN
ncbi:MAG TPA: type II toxin-antitoxin system HicB family antitoxin [Thermoanaerobaculia bacterium]|nr:type II toxin-antitoxin system HicB family antitoxin [Thermoanaerobaculia bacterium]